MTAQKKQVAISQSNYIPWKGYFDLIASVDVFVLYDDMQYTRRDWRNRNKIKTKNGLKWLTIPVEVKGKYLQKIRQVKIVDDAWAKQHWSSIEQNYKDAPYFQEVSAWLKPAYFEIESRFLSAINRFFIELICEKLSIKTEIISSSDFQLVDGKTQCLADLCNQLGAQKYVSGPAAKDYIELEVFESYGIELAWADYSGYNEYPQLWGEFEHSVTILDLLFNVGPDFSKFMKHLSQ